MKWGKGRGRINGLKLRWTNDFQSQSFGLTSLNFIWLLFQIWSGSNSVWWQPNYKWILWNENDCYIGNSMGFEPSIISAEMLKKKNLKMKMSPVPIWWLLLVIILPLAHSTTDSGKNPWGLCVFIVVLQSFLLDARLLYTVCSKITWSVKYH